jgi:hypothetical protein
MIATVPKLVNPNRERSKTFHANGFSQWHEIWLGGSQSNARYEL